MAVETQATYAGGDPAITEAIQGALVIGESSLRFVHSIMTMEGMLPRHHSVEYDWPAEELLGASVGDVAYLKGLTVGGLIPVGDDLMLGGLGQIGGSSSALLLFLFRGEGSGRRLIRFASTAADAQSFLAGLQRERLVRGQAPLPGVDEVDSHHRADDQAAVLTELRDLAREQVELLTEVVRLLRPR